MDFPTTLAQNSDIGGEFRALSFAKEALPLRADEEGVVRVGKTRVTLDTVVEAFSDGATAEEIVQQSPSLNLADVYQVIGYYLRRPAHVDQYLQKRKAKATAVKKKNESKFDPQGLRDRLTARRTSQARQAMLRLAADENFNIDIVRGLLRRKPDLDIVRVQDAVLSGADDSTVLEWTAKEDRILLTHDVSTMMRYAYERIQWHKPMPGIFEVSRNLPIGNVIEDILLLAEYSLEDEWNGQVRYLPLR